MRRAALKYATRHNMSVVKTYDAFNELRYICIPNMGCKQ